MSAICPICLEKLKLENEKIWTIVCGHTFHKKCLLRVCINHVSKEIERRKMESRQNGTRYVKLTKYYPQCAACKDEHTLFKPKCRNKDGFFLAGIRSYILEEENDDTINSVSSVEPANVCSTKSEKSESCGTQTTPTRLEEPTQRSRRMQTDMEQEIEQLQIHLTLAQQRASDAEETLASALREMENHEQKRRKVCSSMQSPPVDPPRAVTPDPDGQVAGPSSGIRRPFRWSGGWDGTWIPTNDAERDTNYLNRGSVGGSEQVPFMPNSVERLRLQKLGKPVETSNSGETWVKRTPQTEAAINDMFLRRRIKITLDKLILGEREKKPTEKIDDAKDDTDSDGTVCISDSD